MRTIRVVAAAIVVVGASALLIRFLLKSPNGETTERTSAHSEIIAFEGSADWPMFHGGQNLLGRAAGTLADKLRPIWKFKTEGAVTASPVVEAGVVYVGSSDANVYAIDIETGSQIWAARTDDAIEAAACVVGDAVYVGDSYGFVHALDKKDGSAKWKYETGGQIVGGANWIASPDGQHTWILVGSYDNMLHCVDSESGEAVWKYETDNYVNGTPAIDSGQTVFGGCDAIIHVISVTDGNEVREVDSGAYIAGSAAFFEGHVYVGNYDGEFLKVDARSGEVLWRYGDKEYPFLSSPAIGRDEVVFGGQDNKVHCVGREDGKPIWTFNTLGEVDGSPAICADKVVVGSMDGRLYVISLSNGSLVWSYEIGQAISSSPAISNGVVVVGGEDGYVYAFGPDRSGRDG